MAKKFYDITISTTVTNIPEKEAKEIGYKIKNKLKKQQIGNVYDVRWVNNTAQYVANVRSKKMDECANIIGSIVDGKGYLDGLEMTHYFLYKMDMKATIFVGGKMNTGQINKLINRVIGDKQLQKKVVDEDGFEIFIRSVDLLQIIELEPKHMIEMRKWDKGVIKGYSMFYEFDFLIHVITDTKMEIDEIGDRITKLFKAGKIKREVAKGIGFKILI